MSPSIAKMTLLASMYKDNAKWSEDYFASVADALGITILYVQEQLLVE